jgi:hypothetical protein
MFLKLSGQIEGQLRDAYAKKYEAGAMNQSALADKLGVDRSAINRRLTGRINMTEETIADMVWGLEHDIEVRIFDPTETQTNHKPIPLNTPIVATPAPLPHLPVANTVNATTTTSSTPIQKLTIATS